MSVFRKNLNSYLGMTKRNILVFFKDKTTLFFSMLAPLIVFFLYIVFLKEVLPWHIGVVGMRTPMKVLKV